MELGARLPRIGAEPLLHQLGKAVALSQREVAELTDPERLLKVCDLTKDNSTRFPVIKALIRKLCLQISDNEVSLKTSVVVA